MIEVTIHFQHSLEMSPRTASLARPSDLTLTLSGQVSPDGNVTLLGSGTFIGGYLNGSAGSLTVPGTIMPPPLTLPQARAGALHPKQATEASPTPAPGNS